jgi:hypothetical protein
VFCNVVCSAMEVLGHEYNPDQWLLFIDSSKVSLKLVLLHNSKRFPYDCFVHAANMNESYKSIWESLRMTNLSGSYMVISSLWHCYLDGNSGTQNPVRVGQPRQE